MNENCRIHSNGSKFYNSLKLKFHDGLTANEQRKLEELVQKIQVKHNLSQEIVNFENELVKKAEAINPDWFLNISSETNGLITAAGNITAIYNKNLSRVKEAFEAESVKAIKKGIQEYQANGYKNIGVSLSRNENPQIADINKVAEIIRA
jgi:hypothetical protein